MKQIAILLALLCATYVLAEVLSTNNKHNYSKSSTTVTNMFSKPTSGFNMWSYNNR